MLGHMHELGSSYRMTFNPGTPDEKVLLDIPVWNFNWQLGLCAGRSRVRSKKGDTVRVTCNWDRKLRYDPDPRYIVFAEGTQDEMCFSTLDRSVRPRDDDMTVVVASRQRSQQVLDAMERRFAKDGIHAVVVSDLARELGMSTKTLYRLFPSKDDLVLAVVERWADRLLGGPAATDRQRHDVRRAGAVGRPVPRVGTFADE